MTTIGAAPELREASGAGPLASRVVLRLVARLVAGLVALVLLAGVALLIALPLITHATARTVRTGSMSPALPVGSVLFDRPVDPARLRVGDIATYRESLAGGDRLVTHRIVAIDPTTSPITFTFRGDANRAADPVAVPASEVVGRVWFDVPYLGSIQSRVAGLRPLLIVVGVIALAGYSVFQLAGGVREWRASG